LSQNCAQDNEDLKIKIDKIVNLRGNNPGNDQNVESLL